MSNRTESNFQKTKPRYRIQVCGQCGTSATKQFFRVPAKEKGKHKTFKQEKSQGYICIDCRK